jgi:hypothetical protein
VAALRRLGFGISELGERKLKGTFSISLPHSHIAHSLLARSRIRRAHLPALADRDQGASRTSRRRQGRRRRREEDRGRARYDPSAPRRQRHQGVRQSRPATRGGERSHRPRIRRRGGKSSTFRHRRQPLCSTEYGDSVVAGGEAEDANPSDDSGVPGSSRCDGRRVGGVARGASPSLSFPLLLILTVFPSHSPTSFASRTAFPLSSSTNSVLSPKSSPPLVPPSAPILAASCLPSPASLASCKHSLSRKQRHRQSEQG